MSIERRRSDRLTMTFPLIVRGEDENGIAFECEAHTINVNRHGARIRISRLLRSGQQVRVLNTLSRKEAVFRVAGPLVPLTEKGGEFGFTGPISLDDPGQTEPTGESVAQGASLWGIRFPPAPGGEDESPKALLACRKCQGMEMVRLGMIEIEVLETAGIFARHCVACHSMTTWGYAESEIRAAGEALSPAAPAGAPTSPRERRKHRRAVLQMPILIRDYFGGIEVTKSENVSKGGIGFASEKVYQLGEGIMVACPYHKHGENIEVPAHIVSCREMDGAHRKIYGVRYKA
ncbi:MAG: PilZ domain-containing protein [Terriglobia bacterium]